MKNEYEIMRLPDVVDATKLSKSTLYRLMGENKFPKSIHISARAVGWLRADIDEYIKTKIGYRDLVH